jgi:hypothetical protein
MTLNRELLLTFRETQDQRVGRNISEDLNLHQHHWENLKFRTTLMGRPLSLHGQFDLNDEGTMLRRNVSNYQSTRRNVPGELNLDRWISNICMRYFITTNWLTSLGAKIVREFVEQRAKLPNALCSLAFITLFVRMPATLPAVRWHRTKVERVHLPHNRCRNTTPG